MAQLSTHIKDKWICMNSCGLFSENEIAFDLINKQTIFFDEESNILRSTSSEAAECNEKPDIFPLGESVISFLELDFEKYNHVLADFVQNYLEYNSPLNLLHYLDIDSFIDLLCNHNLNHPYFTSLDVGRLIDGNINQFKDLMAINPETISAINRFLTGLCGKKYPLDSSQKDTSPTSTLSSDMETIFSFTPQMEVSVLCEAHIEHNSNITKVTSANRYRNTSPISFCVTELFKMIEAKVQIRLCKNCHKYFIPQTNHSSDYCNRICNEKGQTCKEIGAQKLYKNKIKTNPILKEYEKAYKRNYAKAARGDISKEMFRNWADEAIAKRNSVILDYEKNNSQEIVDQFKAFLGNK